MRRKTLVWSAVTLVALLLTPSVVSTVELFEEGNLRKIGHLRSDSAVHYDLDVHRSVHGGFHIDDYYQIEISPPEEVRLIDGTAHTAIRITETERVSLLPVPKDEQALGDIVNERWVDAATGQILATHIGLDEYHPLGDAWYRDHGQRTYLRHGGAAVFAVDRLPTDMVLFHAPVNTTWAMKALDRLDTLENVRAADAAAKIDGRPVLAGPAGRTHTGGTTAPCHLPFLSSAGWGDQGGETHTATRNWYDVDSVFPLQSECRALGEDGALLAAVTRDHLVERGRPFIMERTHPADAAPAPGTVPMGVLPPGADTFPYSLQEAHDALVADPGLTDFQRFLGESDDIVLRWAHLTIGEVTNPPPSMVLPLDPRPQETRAPTYRLMWSLHYLNGAGSGIHVLSERSVQDMDTPTNSEWDLVAGVSDDPEMLFSLVRDMRILPIDQAIRQAQDDGVPFEPMPGNIYSFSLGDQVQDGKPLVRPDHQVTSFHDGGGASRSYDAVGGQAISASTYTRTQGTAPPAADADPTPTAREHHPRTAAGLVAPTAAVAGVSLLTFALLHAKVLPALLYAKIARPRILDHPRRAAIHEHLRQNPGAPLKDVQHALGLGWGSAVHHVRLLEQNRFVTSRRAGRHRRLWVTEDKTVAEVRREALLAEPTPRRILEALQADPALTQAAVARRLDLARSTVHRHIQALMETGLLERGAPGSPYRVIRPDLPSPRHS